MCFPVIAVRDIALLGQQCLHWPIAPCDEWCLPRIYVVSPWRMRSPLACWRMRFPLACICGASNGRCFPLCDRSPFGGLRAGRFLKKIVKETSFQISF